MSSNMYGFECEFWWEGRHCSAQIVYKGTENDEESSREQATRDWETEDPVLLAKYELEHRDWTKQWHADVRIGVHEVYPQWLDTDPDPADGWSPPKPTEREVLQIIADGAAFNIVHGWDT